MQRQHDLGGQSAGPLDLNDPEAPPFGKLFTGILSALRQHDLIAIDEMRRTMEDLPKNLYDLSYYERWGEGMCVLLEEKNIVTRAEVEARMAELKAGYEAQSAQ